MTAFSQDQVKPPRGSDRGKRAQATMPCRDGWWQHHPEEMAGLRRSSHHALAARVRYRAEASTSIAGGPSELTLALEIPLQPGGHSGTGRKKAADACLA